MKTSAKTEYGCLAMLELAARYQSGQVVRVRDIAGRHEIPQRFLVQILLQLKNAGLVASTRGASGGYRLAQPPEEISLAAVMSVIDGRPRSIATGGDNGNHSPPRSPAAKVLDDVWIEAWQVEQQMLDSITLAELARRVKDESVDMYYI